MNFSVKIKNAKWGIILFTKRTLQKKVGQIPRTYLLSGSIYRFLCMGRYFQILCWRYVRQLFNFLKFCRLFSWGIIKHFSLHIFTTSASFYLHLHRHKLKIEVRWDYLTIFKIKTGRIFFSCSAYVIKECIGWLWETL